jgi:Flp pilus assembly protein TadB
MRGEVVIWIWLALAVVPTLGILATGWLLVDRWWWRRKARKQAEAAAAAVAAHMVRAAAAIGGPILDAFRQLAPVMNDAAKSIGRFEEAFRAAKAAESDPDTPPR